MHKAQNVLIKELNEASSKVLVGGQYFHYKNPDNTYKVLQLAIMESDENVCVIYQAQYGEELIFVRPLSSWLEKVQWQEKTVKRFTLIKTN